MADLANASFCRGRRGRRQEWREEDHHPGDRNHAPWVDQPSSQDAEGALGFSKAGVSSLAKRLQLNSGSRHLPP